MDETGPTPPAAAETRKPDAALYPTGWTPPNLKPTDDRNAAIFDYFEAALGTPRVDVRDCAGAGEGMKFVSPLATPHNTLLHPEGHYKAKFPRYDWVDAADGLRLGYLLAED